jgi:quinol monooxygenase YgiN
MPAREQRIESARREKLAEEPTSAAQRYEDRRNADRRRDDMQKVIWSVMLVMLCWGVGRPASAEGPAAAEEPLYVVTHVDVLPKFTKAGRDLLNQFAVDSRKDAGAVRIEVYEELGRRNHSTVVEVWSSRKAYEDHLEAAHTRAYRAKLQPMLGSPFDERLHRLTSPDAER